MEPEFLSSVNAKTALETPQILLEWAFANAETPLTTGVGWDWNLFSIRRSSYRFPEDVSEGTSILTESHSSTPTTAKGDVSSLQAMTHYYYSMFLQYNTHSSSALGFDKNVSRLGTRLTSVCYEKQKSLLFGTNGTSNAGNPVFTIPAPVPPALGFIGSGVEAGFILYIHDGGADDGYHSILSVDSDTQITLTGNLGVGVAGTVDYTVLSDHYKFWMSGISFEAKKTLWRYDTKTEMVDFAIDLSSLLAIGEQVCSIAFANHITDTLGLVTNRRYLSIPDSVLVPTDTDIIHTWSVSAILDPGYLIKGACWHNPGAVNTIYVLDASSLSVVVVAETTGVVSATIDLSNLDEVASDTLYGLTTTIYAGTVRLVVGTRNYAYAFGLGIPAPAPANVYFLTYSTDLISADIGYYRDVLTSVDYLVTVNDIICKLQSYTYEVGRGYLWQQPYVSDKYTIGLYHLDDVGVPTVTDSSGLGYHGVLHGMTSQTAARFADGYEATTVNDYVDVVAIAPAFSGTLGSASIWHAASDATDLSNAAVDRYLLCLVTDVNNTVQIGIVSGMLTFYFISGGTAKTIAAIHPSQDTEFHNYKITWDRAGNTLCAYVDGVQFGATLNALGLWAGALAVATIGGNANNTLLGVYDECRISNVSRVVNPQVIAYTAANRMFAHSGRDYSVPYTDGDRNTYHNKDQLFQPRNFGGEFLIRNDYQRTQLWPPNKITANKDIINRDTVLPKLGDMGRLARLTGELVDRVCDDRDMLLAILDMARCSYSDLPLLAKYLGIPDIDDVDWNVDKLRRYVRHMRWVLKRGGMLRSYHVYAKLLGFLITESTLYSRRHWDTVVDPDSPDVYLDEMGSMDTGDERYPLAHLRFRCYKATATSVVGATSIPATRRLTDAAASFRTTASVGSLIRIHDIDDTADNGDYVVAVVESDTQVLVNQNWPTGGLANLSYSINRRVPRYDPYMSYLFSRFRQIAPEPMEITYLD